MQSDDADEPRSAPEALVTLMRLLRRVVIDLVRFYHRLQVRVVEPIPDRPCLIVANHGFGGVVDLNVFAVLGTLDRWGGGRSVVALTHQLAWTLGVGPLIELVGCRPASHRSARDGFAAGHHVLVLPGGDVDAGKSFADRNRIDFAGRSGFAQVAMDEGVPVVPVVTTGAGETLFVLSSGHRLAHWTRIDKLLRLKALPVSLSIPWGLNVGLVGLLPYLPLPARLATTVLPAMGPTRGETAEEFAERIRAAMQTELTAMTARRRLLLG